MNSKIVTLILIVFSLQSKAAGTEGPMVKNCLSDAGTKVKVYFTDMGTFKATVQKAQAAEIIETDCKIKAYENSMIYELDCLSQDTATHVNIHGEDGILNTAIVRGSNASENDPSYCDQPL